METNCKNCGSNEIKETKYYIFWFIPRIKYNCLFCGTVIHKKLNNILTVNGNRNIVVQNINSSNVCVIVGDDNDVKQT